MSFNEAPQEPTPPPLRPMEGTHPETNPNPDANPDSNPNPNPNPNPDANPDPNHGETGAWGERCCGGENGVSDVSSSSRSQDGPWARLERECLYKLITSQIPRFQQRPYLAG